MYVCMYECMYVCIFLYTWFIACSITMVKLQTSTIILVAMVQLFGYSTFSLSNCISLKNFVNSF